LIFHDFRPKRRDSGPKRPGLCRQVLTSAFPRQFRAEFLENRRVIPDIQA
jgi:hypothetical protein